MVDYGIYRWINLITGRSLVGQVGHTRTFYKRKQGYLTKLRSGTFGNKHFQSSWNKHGEQSFAMEILEELPIGKMTFDEHSAMLTFHEQAWLDYYREQPEGVYNQIGPVNAPRRGTTLSREHKDKISEANSGLIRSQETRDRMSASRMGTKMTPVALAKMKASKKGQPSPRKGIKFTPEMIEKSSLAHMGIRQTEASKQKISDTMKGRAPNNKGKPRSEQAKAKTAATLLAKRQAALTQIEEGGNTVLKEQQEQVAS